MTAVYPGGGGGGSPTGNAGGDLASTYPNPTIKASVALSGNPTAPTQGVRNNSTRIATTAYIDSSRYGGQTLLVAASDSSAAAKRAADFVCTGVDDDLVINTALASLSSVYGGTVLLAETDSFFLGHSGGGVGIQQLAGNQHLVGLAKRDSSQIAVTPGSTIAQMIQVGTSGTGNLFNNSVERVSLDGTNGSSTMNGIVASSNMFLAENVYLQNIKQDAISLSSFIATEFAFQALRGIDIYQVSRDGVVIDQNIYDLRCEEVTVGGIFGSTGRYGFNLQGGYNQLVACRAHDMHLGWGAFVTAGFMLEILGGHFDENGAGASGGGIKCDATTRVNIIGGRYNSNDSYDIYFSNTSNSSIGHIQANGAGTKGPKVESINIAGCTGVTVSDCNLVDMQTRGLVIASSVGCHASNMMVTNPTTTAAHESATLFSCTNCSIRGGTLANGFVESGTSNNNVIDQPVISAGPTTVIGGATIYTPFGTPYATSAALTSESTARSTADALLAPLASPTFTGSPKAPTKSAGDNSTNVATTAYTDVAVAAATGGGLYLPWLVEGLLGWSYDNTSATGTGVAPSATGLLSLAKIPVPVSITVTNLLCRVEAVGTGITSNQSFMAAWSSNGATLLGQTADLSTIFAGTTGTKENACTSPFSVVGGTNVFIYVGILCNATGLPTFQRPASNDGNAGRTGAGLRFARKTTTDTSVPGTITPSGLVSTSQFWMALS